MPDENVLIGKTVLDKYHIIKEIGRGGMGIVYLAKDTRLGRDVALKELVLSKTIAGKNRDDIISRFNREARTTSTLNHSNIVTVFDVGRDNNTHMIAMEYLLGKTLKEYLDDHYSFSYDEILDVFLQVSAGLSHAHSKGVVHRDIKPENITILPEGNVKIMDFGIAAIENSNTNLTQDGSILGTIAYISPEQLYNSKSVDNRADIFSLGVMMYEIFTGKLPFGGESVGETITNIMTTVPEPPQSHNKNLSERLAQIVMRCLKRSPDERFQTVTEVAQAIMDFKTGLSFQELQAFIDPTKSENPSLPRHTHNSGASRNSAMIKTTGVFRRRFRVLYIGEDIALERMLLSNIKLRGLPYALVSYAGLSQAQEELNSSQSADWVIIELTESNKDTSYAFFEYFKDTPLSFISAITDPLVIVDTMKRGAADFVLHSNHVDDSLKLLDTIQLQIKAQNVSFEEAATSASHASQVSTTESPAQAPAELSGEAAVVKHNNFSLRWRSSFGALGAEPGELSSPRHIYYYAHQDCLIVSDTKNSRIQYFGLNGEFLRSVSHPDLVAPCGVCADAGGHIYVLDNISAKIFVFDDSGEPVFQFGGKGDSIHSFASVYGIACFQDRWILVSDPESHLVKVFSLQGKLEDVFGQGKGKHPVYKKPSSLCVSDSAVYLLDQGNSSIAIWDENLEYVRSFGERGTAKGQLGVPKGICVDAQDHLFVAEALPHRFQVFDLNKGNYLLGYGKKGAADGEFNTLDALAIKKDQLFILDKENHRVQQFIFHAL